MAYSVDEVSALLDVPRPTLYRYLREYSIPHLRRSGKIYVPEESFDRIKEVRELHKEGLGTESVRRRLRGESSVEIEGLAERLDRISEALESLQGNLKSANGVSPARVLRTILARQSLLISAVTNLTEMLEELPYANARRRKAAFEGPEEETQMQKAFLEQLEGHPELVEDDPTANEPVIGTPPGPMRSPTVPARGRKRFGVMARRRRRGVLAILLALLTSAALVAYFLEGEEGSGASLEKPSSPPQETAASGSEDAPAGGGMDAAPSNSAAHIKEEPVEYSEGYEGFARERPLYQGQYQAQAATSELPSQEQPVLQSPLDGTGLPSLSFGNGSVQRTPDAPAP